MPHENLNKPFVSALLVTRNEQDYIDLSLGSLLNQDYPNDKYEIIVIDGESTDNTLDKIKSIIDKNTDKKISIRLLSNPMHILSAGWNIGIKAAKGDYVVRIDAHARAMPNFLSKSVETIQSVDAICVGGKLITRTLAGNNETISKVLASPFGVGNSSFRVSDKPGYVDTAVYGLYKKKVFEECGLFSEKYVRNQDLQMHSRIKKSGGKFYFNPEIKCEYFARNTAKKMMKQAFNNGKWNMALLKEDISGLHLRHLIPFFFVLFLMFFSIIGIWLDIFWVIEAIVLLLYFTLAIVATLISHPKIYQIIQMPALFFLLHTSYGLGYFAGVFQR